MSNQKNDKEFKNQTNAKGNVGAASNKRNKKQKNKNKSYHNEKAHSNKNSTRQRNYSDASREYDNDASMGHRKPFDSVRGNDIEWWNKSPLYDESTRVPVNRIYGRGFKMRSGAIGSLGTMTQNADLSGIMAIDFVPSIGTSIDANSAVNRTFNSLFGELYSKTTGTPPIQQMDVAFFMTSLSSIGALIGHCKRALGLSQLYSSWNYNFPDKLILASGIQPKSVIGDQDRVRSKLNDIILNFNNMKVPDVMDIYVRQYALAHNVYCDEDDVTSAMYVFRPTGYYRYKDTENPALLKWMPLPTPEGGIPINTLLSLIDLALEAWRNSSDLPLITGTLQRAFPDTPVISLDYTLETDFVVPTVDRNIMWQINNLNVVDVKPTSLDITQDPVGNFMKFRPVVNMSSSILNMLHVESTDHLLNSYDGNTSPEFIMESTRLKSFYSPENQELTVPTEFVTNISIHYSSLLGGKQVSTATRLDVLREVVATEDVPYHQYVNENVQNGLISQFKIHPYIYNYILVKADEEEGELVDEYRLLSIQGDLYKFTTIDNAALLDLLLAATQSVYRLFLR